MSTQPDKAQTTPEVNPLSDSLGMDHPGIVKETERGSPTTQPAAVVGDPTAGSKPKDPPKGDSPKRDGGPTPS